MTRAEPLPALTGARFFAAAAVVVCHYGLDAVEASVPFAVAPARVGPAAVSLFYVLSGAVLTWGCTNERGHPARPAVTFWVQRAARILPAYLFALALSILPFAAQVMQSHGGLSGVARVVAAVVAALLVVQAFLPPLTAGLNTPGWSISCEAFFYALWPRLVVALRSSHAGFPWRRALTLWCLAVAPTFLGLFALRSGFVPAGPFPTVLSDVSGGELLARSLTYFPPLRLAEFAIGIALGHALRATPTRARSVASDTAREFGLLIALLACATGLGAGLGERWTKLELANRMLIESGLLAPLFALLVWQLARGQGLLKQTLSRRALLVLGEASYALYVLQEPILVWLTAALKRVAPGLMEHWSLTFWAYFALLVAASLLTHRFVEMPLRARLTSRWLPRSAPTATY